jgi:ABC-type transport system involved in multi-copper enzyme maturation permease subunit
LTGRLRELIAWELQDNWAFPVLELILVITIIQVLPIVSLYRNVTNFSMPFWRSMVYVFVICVAVIFGRSFGEGVEKRKLVVLLSYPVSRVRVFAAKFLANFLALLLVFGGVLFVEGLSYFMFKSVYRDMYPMYPYTFSDLAPTIFALMFLSLFLVVFFASSLMTFLSLAMKRFGLSIMVFLVYALGMEYWTNLQFGTKDPGLYLSFQYGPNAIVTYLHSWHYNTLGIGYSRTGITPSIFLTAFCYLLVGGLLLLLASLFLIRRIDLD